MALCRACAADPANTSGGVLLLFNNENDGPLPQLWPAFKQRLRELGWVDAFHDSRLRAGASEVIASSPENSLSFGPIQVWRLCERRRKRSQWSLPWSATLSETASSRTQRVRVETPLAFRTLSPRSQKNG